MSDSSYRVAPIFLLRMAGVPFEPVERLATPETMAAAREVIARQAEFARAKEEVEQLLRHRGHGLSEELFRAWRKAIRTGAIPPAADAPSRAFALCWECAVELARAETDMKESLPQELAAARQALLRAAQIFLPPYLVFVAEGLRERLSKQSSHERGPLRPRKKEDRGHEGHLLLYLQRICAKNDSLSEFGPEGWGTTEKGVRDLKLEPQPGITARETFLERWTAQGVAAALNVDPEIRVELSPRLHPNGRIDGNHFVFADTAETTPLDPKTVEILDRCDGATPAYSFGKEIGVLEQLAAQNMILWEVEVPALEPHAFDVLISDIEGWRDTPVRARWLDLLQPIAALPSRFAQAGDTPTRAEIIDEARRQLQNLGTARETSDRFLYSASNPIGEECFRECHFSIGEDLINEVTTEAEPWIDLWRDTYAFIASRVAAGLRNLFQTASIQDGAVPLPSFLKHCEMQKLPLTGHGIVALAHIAFQEVKTAFRQEVNERAAQTELALSEHDCHFVRRNFAYEKFDEYTYPSADLQISATSAAEAAAGNYEWIVSELHPPVALLHHCFYWSCPDRAQLSRALASTTFGRPAFHYGFFAADFTAHTAVRWIDALPELTHFVAPQRGKSHCNIVPPAEAEVYLDEQTGDVCVRKRDSSEYLGSFARSWVIPLGFHPFHFGGLPHMPRLRCGRVIVQRRTWTVRHDEFAVGNYTGVSRDLVLAVERLRAEKDWPRHIYIRPSEQALRRSGAEGRDKDTKPVYIDLESYLFLEIFYRWLTKSGELEVAEMLPDPEHLLWQEADGRRTFELRTQIVPG